jgi:hypothetical protein
LEVRFSIGEEVRFAEGKNDDLPHLVGVVGVVDGFHKNDPTCLMLKGKMNPKTKPGWFHRSRFEHTTKVFDDKPAAPDMVNHPKHYSRWKMEPIEFIAINNLPWWLANVIKYTMRFDAKDGLQDLYKARSYLDMKIAEIEGVLRFWDKPVAEERKLNRSGAMTYAEAFDKGLVTPIPVLDACPR